MQKRTSALRRPSGTDGSDFSYRMVVDPRYTKVAEGKSRLRTLFIFQAVIQLIGVLITFLYSSKEEASVLSIAIGFISLLIGELGRRRSQANFLRLYIVVSSISALLSVLFVRSSILLEVFHGLTLWSVNKSELIRLGYVLLGMLVEIFAITTTVLLIRNMAPPKRSS